jgi:UDP-N-acetylglucosamine transferase subunit ALG13
MILVSIGNATQGFSRLLDSVDKLAGDGIFGDETVIIQSGSNRDFRAVHCKQVDFLSMDQFAEMVMDANLVICHAGAGTLYHAFQAGKLPIVMPRRKKYGEHIEDQLELVKTLAADGRIIPAYEPEDLPGAIEEAKRRNGLRDGGVRGKEERSQMIELIAEAIEKFISNN